VPCSVARTLPPRAVSSALPPPPFERRGRPSMPQHEAHLFACWTITFCRSRPPSVAGHAGCDARTGRSDASRTAHLVRACVADNRDGRQSRASQSTINRVPPLGSAVHACWYPSGGPRVPATRTPVLSADGRGGQRSQPITFEPCLGGPTQSASFGPSCSRRRLTGLIATSTRVPVLRRLRRSRGSRPPYGVLTGRRRSGTSSSAKVCAASPGSPAPSRCATARDPGIEILGRTRNALQASAGPPNGHPKIRVRGDGSARMRP